MSAEALNANPTVLNVSDLPTRRRQQEQRYQGTSSTKNFASFVTSVRCTPDVLAADGSSDSSLLDETDDESDALPEQIDEQEVFGMLTSLLDCPMLLSSRVHIYFLQHDKEARNLNRFGTIKT